MNNLFRWPVALGLAAFLAAVPGAQAQQRNPHIGYIYPAGGRQDTTFEVTVGGQYLDGAADVYVSGEGVGATVIKHTKPLKKKLLNQLRQKLKELRDAQRSEQAAKKSGPAAKKKKGAENLMLIRSKEFKDYAKILGLEEMDLKVFLALRKKLLDPKRQPNPQIAETVTLRVTMAPEAEPGKRELRMKTKFGVSNPLFFHVGQLRECREKEPNNKTADDGIGESLPGIVNGQIMPGDIDRFRFKATKGMRLVVSVDARELMPYLADAVPGWFQATLTLYDEKQNRVAYTDDYRFHPDPVLYYEVPKDGQYVLEIKDAIYRGREDFVYRIALGEMPFITSIFPLGGRAGTRLNLKIKGWNLPVDRLTLDAKDKGPGILPVFVRKDNRISNRMPFALDTLPECLEKEPNNKQRSAQRVKLPLIVNGRIDLPGDWDVFRFEGRAGDEIVAEIQARRLESPLDSLLKLTDGKGRQLMTNDDHEDKGAGLTTHHADSFLSLKLPADGYYLLHLGDTQHKGGTAYGYRLRISPRRPDFELRVAPSGINTRAGMTVPLTIYALRKDGFSGDITLELKDSPRGFTLSGGRIPAHQVKMRVTLTVPRVPREEPVNLRLEGRAMIQGKEIYRPAIPAEDMMQAFIYRHLVPAKDFMVVVTGRRRFGRPFKLVGETPVRLAASGTTQIRFAGPKGPLMKQVQLELSEPPEGIAIQKVSPDEKGGLAFLLSVDAGKVKPGLAGNLIVNAFIEKAVKSKDGKPKPNKRRRIPLGALPALPFEIAGPQRKAP